MSESTHENKKARLGRGLGSLLESSGAKESLGTSINKTTEVPMTQTQVIKPKQQEPAESSIPLEARIWNVAIDKLNPNEYQPRQDFKKEGIEDLTRSIKEKGILQPIVARRHINGTFEIIAGERRWRAAQAAGLHEVPVIIKVSTDQEALELAIIENIQREDLNPVEEAEAYQRMAQEFHLTQQQIAEKVGKERATVANSMRLLLLPKEIKDMLIKSAISVGHAKLLLSLEGAEKQLELAKIIANDKLSVRATEKVIARFAKSKVDGAKVEVAKPNISAKLAQEVAQSLQKQLGTKVEIKYHEGKGHLTIYFYGDDQLNQITDKLKK